MNRRKFVGIAGGTTVAAAITSYSLSDKSNLVRADIKPADDDNDRWLVQWSPGILRTGIDARIHFARC